MHIDNLYNNKDLIRAIKKRTANLFLKRLRGKEQ